jgi:hypothetical protein
VVRRAEKRAVGALGARSPGADEHAALPVLEDDDGRDRGRAAAGRAAAGGVAALQQRRPMIAR